jgi:hypothetical protein
LVVDGEPLERGHQLEVPERLAEAQAGVPGRLAEVERSAVVLAGGERVPVVREELAEGPPLVLELLRYVSDLFFLSVDHACFPLYLTYFVACAGSVRFPEC